MKSENNSPKRRGRPPVYLPPLEIKPQVGQIWRTRSGEKARIVCVDRMLDRYPIVMLVGADEDPWSCTEGGQVAPGIKHDCDLVELARDPERIEGWLNLYREGQAHFHRTREDAEKYATPDCVGTVKVTGTGEVKQVRRLRKLAGSRMVENTDSGIPDDSANRAIQVIDTVRRKTHKMREAQ